MNLVWTSIEIAFAISGMAIFILLLVVSLVLVIRWQRAKLQISLLEAMVADLRQSNDELSVKLSDAQVTTARSSTEVDWLKTQRLEQQGYLEELKRTTRIEFQVLAQNLLETKAQALTEQTEKGIANLLLPLNEKIQIFQKKVEDAYSQESRERFSLQGEIQRLVKLSGNLGEETQALVRALKSDSKVQGTWGELVLERVLETAGLRNGEEYETQFVVEAEAGGDQRPDVVIRLADGRHLILDAKVSLTAYERARSASTEKEKVDALKEHVLSLSRHVRDLSGRHYPKAKGVDSPEFVFMFLPIEGALFEALVVDPDLWNRAWRDQVAIVTPQTLLPSLRTVGNIWQVQRQRQNAQEIAVEAGRIYDKFVGFLDDYEKLGRSLEGVRAVYETAQNKLRLGPGNVIRRIEKLRELGAMPAKRIRQDLLETTGPVGDPEKELTENSPEY